MSAEACKFVNPLSFEALSKNIVLSENNQMWASECVNESIDKVADKTIVGVNHISYAKWADIVLIAPATANSIAKIAYGIADSVMLSAILATSAPKILAPAMNTAMLDAPQTKRSLDTLISRGYEIIPSRSSLLACGDYGNGALAEVDEIIFCLARALYLQDSHLQISYFQNSNTHNPPAQIAFWRDREVIITGGGSKENIDLVRYISNHSSGKQASALALALYMLGARVRLISSAFPITLPLGIECKRVQSVRSYDEAISEAIHTALDLKSTKKPALFMVAALADYAPTRQEGKLKKEQIGDELILVCHKTKDILSHICADKIYKIGFKAETDEKNALNHAQNMLKNKHCEAVCLNVINANNPFGGENNALKIITSQGIEEISGSKFDVALKIALFIAPLLTYKDLESQVK